jgi:hypothetical protein
MPTHVLQGYMFDPDSSLALRIELCAVKPNITSGNSPSAQTSSGTIGSGKRNSGRANQNQNQNQLRVYSSSPDSVGHEPPESPTVLNSPPNLSALDALVASANAAAATTNSSSGGSGDPGAGHARNRSFSNPLSPAASTVGGTATLASIADFHSTSNDSQNGLFVYVVCFSSS